ncbi:Protein SRG1 [Glycine soja]
MDPEIVKKLGSSLLVPSVQELAKQGITKVPERYVRPNEDPCVEYDTTSLPQVPVIDLSKLLSEDDAAELEKLDHACKEWGFFQLINHGVNPCLVEYMKKNVQELFNLPHEEKKLLWQKPGEMEGFGQMFVVSEEHKLEWADLFYISTLPSYARHPHLFPNIPRQFRDNLEKYSLELKKLCILIFEFMTKALKIQPNELLDFFEEGGQAMRMNYYPPCPQPEQVIGLNPHSDAGALTILLQVNEMDGLQIRKDGMWIPIKPLSNAFVINVGDMLEIMTNGIYRSIEHKATVNSEKERISVATFHSPRLTAVIGPAQSLITPERPATFNSISVEDFFKGYFSRELQGKSYIDVMRIQNGQHQGVSVMDPQIANKLGTSLLLVPSVHELAKQPMTIVPERYIHPNQDPPSVEFATSHQVPVIDLNKLLSEDENELEKFDLACKEWGFFQLINHGINPSTLEKVKISVEEFFSLPMKEKKKFWQNQGDLEGYGQNFVVSEEQKLEWADLFYIFTLPSEAVESYSLELEKLCMTIIKLMAKTLKIKPNELLELFEDVSQAMRMNCYPPCPQPEHVIGLNPHSDAGALTILLQVNDTEGLEIRKDGMWVPIKPFSNAFVINIGDILEILTNGIYRSIEHRATINSEKQRISIATFHGPQMNKIIGPTPSLVTPDRPALFKRIGVADYYKGYFSRELNGKSYLDVELAKQAIINVPEKYLRPNQDSHVIVDSTLTLPLIDLSKLLSEDVTELEKLNNACKEWGFFQILTNGIYRSIEHRVTINSEKERISIATFHRPHVNRVIGPTPSFVTSERPAVFKRITVGDYYRAYSSRELNGKSCLDFIRIPNEISFKLVISMLMAMHGTSCLVPSVQELAKQPIIEVPERYVHANQDPHILSNTISLPQVPIIDLHQLLSEDPSELEKLDHACKEWGFFQLINHGVDPPVVENMKIGVQEFFNLPMEEKQKFWQTPEDMQGFGQLFVVSEEQKLEWADMFYAHTFPLHSRNPHLIPKIPQPFRENLENYCLELRKMCITIIGLMKKALKIKTNELSELFEDPSQGIRMNYYPPCPQPERVIGINPHSDSGALTILLQVNEVEGLQIRKDGKWIPVKPLSNAFVINVGDMLEILTNGIYRSIEHRGIVNSEKERISIAMFHRPQMSRVIGPAPSLVTPERPALFKRIGVADYLNGFLKRELKGKSYMDVIRIQNEIGLSLKLNDRTSTQNNNVTDGSQCATIVAIKRANPGAALKLCLGDLLVMGSNPETVSLHMQGGDITEALASIADGHDWETDFGVSPEPHIKPELKWSDMHASLPNVPEPLFGYEVIIHLVFDKC